MPHGPETFVLGALRGISEGLVEGLKFRKEEALKERELKAREESLVKEEAFRGKQLELQTKKLGLEERETKAQEERFRLLGLKESAEFEQDLTRSLTDLTKSISGIRETKRDIQNRLLVAEQEGDQTAVSRLRGELQSADEEMNLLRETQKDTDFRLREYRKSIGKFRPAPEVDTTGGKVFGKQTLADLDLNDAEKRFVPLIEAAKTKGNAVLLEDIVTEIEEAGLFLEPDKIDALSNEILEAEAFIRESKSKQIANLSRTRKELLRNVVLPAGGPPSAAVAATRKKATLTEEEQRKEQRQKRLKEIGF